MKSISLWLLKNSVVLVNLAAFSAAIELVMLYHHWILPETTSHSGAETILRLGLIGDTAFVVLAITVIAVYERPWRRVLSQFATAQPIAPQQLESAQRRVLGEPGFIIKFYGLSMAIGAIGYGLWLWIGGIQSSFLQLLIAEATVTYLIALALAMVASVWIIQNRLIPRLFPSGGLHRITEGRWLRVRYRFFVLLLSVNILPMLIIFVTQIMLTASGLSAERQLTALSTSIWYVGLMAIGVGIVIAMIMSDIVARSVNSLIKAIRQIARGSFSERVKIISNDELGYIGEVINDMTQGLQERDRLRQSLYLAMEVQQNLLPKSAPQVPGLQIAGHSIYCDETGGDYFDYFVKDTHQPGQISVAVGDVAGHGIAPALLMASARALLRQHAMQRPTASAIVSAVNRSLALDVQDSGRFMTLFYAEIDGPARHLAWVRAGHEPAILYDPTNDTFETLTGRGVALGVLPEAAYPVSRRSDLKTGQLLLIGTDGIWETLNPAGQMFGKEALYQTVRRHATAPADVVVSAVFEALHDFQGDRSPADDVTLVVVRFV
jgi:sigma-B regulation protein RsbU (phosphoserine phosphatase)